MQFVELPDALAEHAAQVLNHRHLGSRYIEVFVSSEAEASQAGTPVNLMVPHAGAGSWQPESAPPTASVCSLSHIHVTFTPEGASIRAPLCLT